MSYGWDMAADRWSLALTLPQGDVLRTEGVKPMAPRLSDLLSLCRPDARRHPSVLWFGVTRGAALPNPDLAPEHATHFEVGVRGRWWEGGQLQAFVALGQVVERVRQLDIQAVALGKVMSGLEVILRKAFITK